MGSFNVAGTMSNISIGVGQKIVFIPLLPTNYKYNKDKNVIMNPQTMIVSNEGAAAYYSPRFLPIIGEYDDYGGVENIERDKNVEHIEEYFQMSINDFIDYLVCNRDAPESDDEILREENLGKEKYQELKSLSGMFEVYDVYKKMTQYSVDSDDAFNSITLNEYTLRLLGFVKSKEKLADERFSSKYTHPLIENLEVHSDGRFSRAFFINENEKENVLAYSPQYLEDELHERNIIVPQFEKLKGISLYSILFDAQMEKENEGNNEDKDSEVELLMKEVKSEFEKKNKFSAKEITQKLGRIREAFQNIKIDTERDPALNAFHNMDYVFKKEFKEPFVELLEFSKIMFCTNNFFFPAMNGEQDGNPLATKKLTNVVLECVENREGEIDG